MKPGDLSEDAINTMMPTTPAAITEDDLNENQELIPIEECNVNWNFFEKVHLKINNI